jgi:flagellar motor switch protein FliG
VTEELDHLEREPEASLALATLDDSRLSGPRKAAVLCLMLGDDVAAEMLKHLDEAEIELIFRELTTIRQLSPEAIDSVVKEFHELFSGERYAVPSGMDFAKKLVNKAFGPENGRNMLNRILPPRQACAEFETFQKVSPQELAKFLQNEHPQTVALVLAHLDATAAAETLAQLPESQRSDLIMRLAHLQTIPQEIIGSVLLSLDQKLKSVATGVQQVGGVRTAAELCNRLDRYVARQALDEIELICPELALSIRNLMVTFEDLLLIEDVGIREIIKLVDKKVISLALKGAQEEIQKRFYTNMSARAVELMKEEMEYLGPVKVKDVSAARREIITVLRDLDERGVISLSSSSASEEGYVS